MIFVKFQLYLEQRISSVQTKHNAVMQSDDMACLNLTSSLSVTI